jgi:hypothetical protein
VDEMFSNQIPSMPDFGREPIQAATPELTNEIPQLYPQPPEQPQGWGLTFMLTIHEGATGRGRNTGWWAGLPNLFWWADREKGVGGMIASQIVPFAGKFRVLFYRADMDTNFDKMPKLWDFGLSLNRLFTKVEIVRFEIFD